MYIYHHVPVFCSASPILPQTSKMLSDAQDKNIRPSFWFGFLKESFPEDIIKSNEGKSLRVQLLARNPPCLKYLF